MQGRKISISNANFYAILQFSAWEEEKINYFFFLQCNGSHRGSSCREFKKKNYEIQWTVRWNISHGIIHQI